VVEEPVEQRDGGGVLGQEAAPFLERPVAGDAEAASLVGGGDEAEEQLRAGVVERGEADLVDEQEVETQQRVDLLADAVVGEAAVELLDELVGAQADAQAGLDGGEPAADQQVGLAGAGRVGVALLVLSSRCRRGCG
jgi:hypothetical protein